MTVKQLVQMLGGNKESSLHIMLSSGEFVPDHFHVTEIGCVRKDFIDCGGARRRSVACSLQVWTADDVGHRLTAGKLASIFRLARPVVESEELAVEVEYGVEAAAQHRLMNVEATPKGLLFVLAGRRTECLAPDKCGVGECRTAGCC